MMKNDNELLVLDRYEVLGTLHRAPATEVLLTYDRHLGRRVVLKKMTVHRQGLAAASLVRHARLAATLSHPNIAATYDVESDGENVYVASEWLEGQTLRGRLREGPLQVEVAGDIAHQVACALAWSHANGVIHRDIKPGNVFLLPEGGVKITDFGLYAEAPLHSAPVRRTPGYMAPEQVRGEQTTEATDVWALGALLYEMITGQRPFLGESVDAFRRILLDEPQLPRRLRPDTPAALQEVILKSLHKDPLGRFPTVTAFLRALHAAGGRPRIHVAAEQPIEKERPATQGLGAALWLALVALALTALAVTVWWLAARTGTVGGTSPAVRTLAGHAIETGGVDGVGGLRTRMPALRRDGAPSADSRTAPKARESPRARVP